MTEFASVSGAGGGGVSTLNGQSGALITRAFSGHRLTISSGVPVMSTTVNNATSHIVTPYLSDIIPLFDGTNVIPTVFPETSQALSDTTKSPAATVANSVYDVFAWNDGGTLRATRGPLWTNDTTRSAGTALTRVNGLLLNNASITNGPAAQRGTYIGTFRTDGGNLIQWQFGAAASGGTAGIHHIWNYWNRVDVVSTVIDSGAGYTYTTATIRQARASAGNQVSMVFGLAEDGITCSYTNIATIVAANGAVAIWGFDLDSTTTLTQAETLQSNNQGTNTYTAGGSTSGGFGPQLGRHFISANEKGDAVNANTFNASQNAGTLTVRTKM